MTQDRRAAIEAALDANEEANENAESSQAAESSEVSTEVKLESQETAAEPVAEAQAAESTEEVPADTAEVEGEAVVAEAAPVDEPAPQAWKANAKSKWATVDPEVRQEVQRREREVTKVLSESASARQLQNSLREIVSPYQARFQSMGINPLQAVNNLLQADYQLANGSKHQRAQLVAKLIKDYDVDIGVLDGVLAGTVQTGPATEFEQLLDQRLAPVQKKLDMYEQREQAVIKQQEQAFEAELEAMSTDTVKFPHFEKVRTTMADLYEINARRGAPQDLKTLYNRAVATDLGISPQVESAKQAEQVKLAAKKAQQAKLASSSVNGAPSGALASNKVSTDRRATIAAAMDALGG